VPSEPLRSRALVAGWLAAAFALSAVRSPAVLAAALATAAVLFRRGAPLHLRRAALAVLPVSAAAVAAALLWHRLAGGPPPPPRALLALPLRALLLAFLGLAVLARANLFHALGRWPAAVRLLALTLAQVHALRLVATESALGLRSRLARRPRAADVVRGAGAVTGTLLTLSARNARDAADALRSRGI
jgi:cobalt/nickel transport system permease protein